jgi:hypothetical protein
VAESVPGSIPKLISDARKQWERCAEAEDKQRKVMLECKKYRAGKQWPEEIAIARQGGAALQGQAAKPPRPMITVDRVSQPVRLISNAIRSAHYGLDILPNGYGADNETAKIFKGYIRRMQNLCRTEDPIAWAADQAVESGIGWFRLRAEYVEPQPSEGSLGVDVFDQELRLERITNNLAVYCDPAAEKPDRSDAQYLFVTEDIPRSEFKRRWPKADMKGLDDFTSTGDKKWSAWANDDTIRIAEYWRIEYTAKEFALLENGQVVEGKDIPDGVVIKAQRSIDVPNVRMTKITAVEELKEPDAPEDDGKWLGTRIPVFPIAGEELNLDGERILRGMIESAMDPQRMLNFSYSAVVEMYALATKSPWVVAEGQTEGYEAIWQNANRDNYSFIPYKPVSLAGAPVPPPQRQVAEPPIQAAVEMVKIFEDAVKATTATYDPGLGNISAQEKSGRAILALQQQGEQTQSHFSANVEQAWLAVGQEIVRIVPQITRPGQILQILGIDDKPEQVMVGQPFQMQQGAPVPSPPGITPELAKASQGMHKFYDLKQGRYAVTVNVGKAYATRRQEGASMVGDFIEKNPALLNVLGDIFFRDLDFPGSDEISERMKMMLPPQLQNQNGDGPNPAVLQQKLQQMQTLFKHMTDELNAKNHIIETEQVKAQQDLQKEQLKGQLDLEQTKIEWDKKIELEIIKAQSAATVAELKAGYDQLSSQVEQINSAFQRVLTGGHEAAAQARDHAQEQAMQQQQHAHEQQLAAQQQEHEQGLAEQQAQMQPTGE